SSTGFQGLYLQTLSSTGFQGLYLQTLSSKGPFAMSATPAHRASTGERINTPETTGNLIKVLGERGIRLTRQRRVILQVMDDAEQHLDVDQILERARQIDAGVHLVTVYRTIELLKKERLID